MKKSKIIHKTCPTWGVTVCWKNIFAIKQIKTSNKWRDITCSVCLKDKPKNKK